MIYFTRACTFIRMFLECEASNMKFCPNCGHKLEGEHKFCPECGFDLISLKQNEKEEKPVEAPVEESVNEPVQEEDYGSVNPVIPTAEDAHGEEPAKKKRKLSKLNIFFIIVAAPLVAFYIVAIVLAATKVTPWLLLLSGILDFGVAVATYYIWDYRERYICPECGTKRTRVRVLTETKRKAKPPIKGVKEIVLTHYYDATYTCPKCGCELKQREYSSGGSIKVSQYNENHIISDNSKSPKL